MVWKLAAHLRARHPVCVSAVYPEITLLIPFNMTAVAATMTETALSFSIFGSSRSNYEGANVTKGEAATRCKKNTCTNMQMLLFKHPRRSRVACARNFHCGDLRHKRIASSFKFLHPLTSPFLIFRPPSLSMRVGVGGWRWH